jgi:hypothetical protein
LNKAFLRKIKLDEELNPKPANKDKNKEIRRADSRSDPASSFSEQLGAGVPFSGLLKNEINKAPQSRHKVIRTLTQLYKPLQSFKKIALTNLPNKRSLKIQAVSFVESMWQTSRSSFRHLR